MKRKLMPYLLSYAFLFVSYLIISFIMAILFSFMHVSSFIYQLLITFFSYLILVVFTFIFYKMVKEKPLIHGMTLSMTYLIIHNFYIICFSNPNSHDFINSMTNKCFSKWWFIWNLTINRISFERTYNCIFFFFRII